MEENFEKKPIGFFKITAALFGSTVVIGAIVFFLILFYALDHTPPAYSPQEKFEQQFQNYYFLTKEDFYLSAILSGVAAILFLGFGITYWIKEGNSEDFKKDVTELYENAFVRFFGIVLNSMAISGIVFIVLEYSFATPEYPAKYHEAPEFIFGIGIITTIIYGLILLIKSLIKKIRN